VLKKRERKRIKTPPHQPEMGEKDLILHEKKGGV